MSARAIPSSPLPLLALAGGVLALAAGCSRPGAIEPAPAPCVQLPLTDSPHQLTAGTDHCYALPRRAKQALHGVVDQRGVDVVLTLYDPRGEEVWTLNGITSALGPEVFDAVAEKSGEYRLRLWTDQVSRTGTYRIAVDPAHTASRGERLRATACGEVGLGIKLRYSPELKDRERAPAHFARAGELWKLAGDPNEADVARYRVGMAYRGIQDWSRALAVWAPLRSRWRGHPLEARLLNRMGDAWDLLGKPDWAAAAFREAMAISHRRRNAEEEAMAHHLLAEVFRRQGEFQAAEDESRKALELLAAAPWADRTLTLTSLGLTLVELGKADEALEIGEKMAAGSARLSLDTLRMIAIARQTLAKRGGEGAQLLLDGAIDAGRKAVSRARELGERGQWVSAQSELASLLFLQERYTEAEELLKVVEEQSVTVKDFIAYASALSHRGVIAAEQRHDPGGLELSQRAQEVFEKRGDRAAMVAVLYGRARILRALGRLAEARRAIESSIRGVEEFREEARKDLQSLHFVDLRSRQYELLVEILMELAARHPGQGFDRLAFTASERMRARVLLDELTEVRDFAGVDPAALAGLRSRQNRLRSLRAQRDSQVGRRSSAAIAQTDPLDRQIAAAQADLRQEWSRIERLFPRYKELVRPHLPDVEEVQSWLDPETTLLSFAVYDKQTFAWQIGAGSFSAAVLPVGREALAREIAAASPAWQAKRREEWQRAFPDLQRLSQELLGPLAGNLTSRLIFVPDGPLHRLPFAVLDTSRSGAPRFLIEDHEISLLPSAAVLPQLRSPRREGRPSRLLAVFAVSEFPPATRLPPLLTVQREAVDILNLARPLGPVQGFLGPEAQLDALERPEAREAQILHFATHAVIDAQTPAKSRIVLAGPGVGFLYPAQIYRLQLKADLVVLSACETGVGPNVTGEGLMSLARGFFYTGAPRVLASLWNINDKATASLMPRFYRALLAGGRPPVAALREAQLSLLRGGGAWTAPYYWAGFALQGDGFPARSTNF